MSKTTILIMIALIVVVACGVAFLALQPGNAPVPIVPVTENQPATQNNAEDTAKTADPVKEITLSNETQIKPTYATEAFAQKNPFRVDINPMDGYTNPFGN